MKILIPLFKIFRKSISLLVRFLPDGSFVDLLVWPVSKRLFGYGYVETVQIDSNLRMSIYGDMEDMVNKSLLFMSGYKKLAWESATAHFVKFMASNIKVAVVAGSHIGYYPLIIGANNTEATIHAFEPNPSNYSRFIKNININKLENIKPSPYALGDKDGEEKMFFDFGQSSFIESKRKHSGSGVVPVVTLDSFFDKQPENPDFMILDAEGYEPNIISGGQKIIDRSKPDIIFEINPKLIKMLESGEKDLCDLLISKGYSIFVIEDKYDHPLSSDLNTKIKLTNFNDLYIGNMPFVNVFATIDENKIKQFL